MSEGSSDGFTTDDYTLVLLALLGLWVGSIIGAMSQIIPFQLVELLGVGIVVAIWQLPSLSFITLAAFMGVFFGGISARCPGRYLGGSLCCLSSA